MAWWLALMCTGLAAEDGFRYAEDRAPAIVNPLFATSMAEARFHELVFEGLFSDDAALNSIPALAERLELSEDKQSAQLHLRHGVRWHDGKPFDAEDVLFTIRAMQDPETASTERGRVGWITSAEKTDPHTIQLVFERPEHAPEDKLQFKILPEHRFGALPILRTDPFRNRPVGTGPWVVQAFNADNSVTVTANDDYWGTVQIPSMTLREVSDKNYQAKLLIYKSLDALVRVLPRDLAALQGDRNIELYPYQTNSWWYMGFNLDHSDLSNQDLRLAIALLMDVPELLRPIGTGEILSGPFVVSSPYYNHDVTPRSHDAEQAARLLRQAGYTFNGRQWMSAGGKPLKLRLAAQADLETSQDVVINLQSQLQNQGIGIEPEFLGRAAWKKSVWRDQDFDLILSQWSFDRNEDIYEQFHSDGVRNFVGYESERVDRLLEAARVTSDPQEKKASLRQVHATVSSDLPMVFLWTLDSYAAISTRVDRVSIHPFYFFTWATDWTVR